jgi:hypothetical protein
VRAGDVAAYNRRFGQFGRSTVAQVKAVFSLLNVAHGLTDATPRAVAGKPTGRFVELISFPNVRPEGCTGKNGNGPGGALLDWLGNPGARRLGCRDRPDVVAARRFMTEEFSPAGGC